jgi:hypothetical protein
MQPYTYLIRWPQLNISYYGVRYAQDCNPSDLWNPYKTSSHHVKEFIKENGEPTVIQVRKVFKDVMSARLWEHRVLKRMKVVSSDKWLNKTDNKSIAPLYGEDHPHYGKRGTACHSYGIKKPAIAEKMRIFQSSLGDKHNFKQPTAMAKRAEKMHGDNHHMKRPEVAEKVSGKNNWIYKKPGALDARSKQFIEMNKARKGTHYRKVKCQHCNNEYGSNNIKRHENFCQTNLTSLVVNTDDIVYNKS